MLVLGLTLISLLTTYLPAVVTVIGVLGLGVVSLGYLKGSFAQGRAKGRDDVIENYQATIGSLKARLDALEYDLTAAKHEIGNVRHALETSVKENEVLRAYTAPEAMKSLEGIMQVQAVALNGLVQSLLDMTNDTNKMLRGRDPLFAKIITELDDLKKELPHSPS